MFYLGFHFKIWFQNRRAKHRRSEKYYLDSGNLHELPSEGRKISLDSKDALCKQLETLKSASIASPTLNNGDEKTPSTVSPPFSISKLIHKSCSKYFAFDSSINKPECATMSESLASVNMNPGYGMVQNEQIRYSDFNGHILGKSLDFWNLENRIILIWFLTRF